MSRGFNSSNLTDALRVRISKLSKHELEELRSLILKELKTRFSYNHKEKYQVPIEEKVPNDLELQMIFQATGSEKYKIFFKTLAYTGARPIEAVKLKLEDIDFKEKCIRVWVAKKYSPVKLPKYMPEQLELDLKLWVRSQYKTIAKKNNYIFFNRQSDSHITVTEASKSFRESVNKCDLDKFYTIADDKNNPIIKNQRKLRNYTLRSLRKYFDSKVYEYSKDGLMASRLLHHEHIDTTNKYYLAISKDKKREVVNKAFAKRRK